MPRSYSRRAPEERSPASSGLSLVAYCSQTIPNTRQEGACSRFWARGRPQYTEGPAHMRRALYYFTPPSRRWIRNNGGNATSLRNHAVHFYLIMHANGHFAHCSMRIHRRCRRCGRRCWPCGPPSIAIPSTSSALLVILNIVVHSGSQWVRFSRPLEHRQPHCHSTEDQQEAENYRSPSLRVH